MRVRTIIQYWSGCGWWIKNLTLGNFIYLFIYSAFLAAEVYSICDV